MTSARCNSVAFHLIKFPAISLAMSLKWRETRKEKKPGTRKSLERKLHLNFLGAHIVAPFFPFSQLQRNIRFKSKRLKRARGNLRTQRLLWSASVSDGPVEALAQLVRSSRLLVLWNCRGRSSLFCPFCNFSIAEMLSHIAKKRICFIFICIVNCTSQIFRNLHSLNTFSGFG